jgi:hypothetical protein
VLLQHDVPQWASGGLVVGGTASNPILDAAYTYASGQTLTVIFPALKRVTGTISGLSGNTFSVSGYSGVSVKRLVFGSGGGRSMSGSPPTLRRRSRWMMLPRSPTVCPWTCMTPKCW